ncbi:Na+/H+ antiporter subunit D [Thiospirochaeta perfilievii]|uniref:Na+/H+ antiporter subunit D n=1 Tax=Thiospirochaeta perfilievii TaxID=252967 RepID=A0A5C1Q9W3_9SPIO|nr:Na+/H+ antiporter subunit E [Thiospirochaeta perfilievii]QEN03900.1 Na+/H+ antiporter subunit D [Thiospirochaeta perfilievii]
MNRVIIRAVIMFLFWILLTASLSLQELVVGLIVSIITSWASIKISPEDPGEGLTLKNWLLYAPILLIEIVKANIYMAKVVLSPKMNINPGFVKIPTKLTSARKKWFLAEAITLTPGTVTVDIIDNYLIVHWINVESDNEDEQGRIIKESFEKALS